MLLFFSVVCNGPPFYEQAKIKFSETCEAVKKINGIITNDTSSE